MMQYITIEVAQFMLNPELRITLKEHGGSIPHHDYIVEVKENGQWVAKDKNYFHYLDNDKKICIIKRWAERVITSREAKHLLDIK